MAPHLPETTNTHRQRAWWRPTTTFNDRLVLFHNQAMANTPSDFTRIITRDILWNIFSNTMDSNMFEISHHFITQQRFYTTQGENQGYILCPKCKDKHIHTFIDTPVQLFGGDHFCLPKTLVFSILELRSLWCRECRIQLFTWYTDSECPSDTHTH